MKSVSDILGPWEDPNWDSGLIHRLKAAWNKPMDTFTNEELATFLRQDMAVSNILPIAQQRLKEKFDDGSEMYEGELQKIVSEILSRQPTDSANDRRGGDHF
jgi:hypothetical protein